MNNVIQYLAELVAMPTITEDTLANTLALDYLERFFSERGMHCQRHDLNGTGALTASTRADNHYAPAALLAAHVDVVTGDESLFTVREEDGKLIGRGVYDMKFAIAGYMQLVDELKDNLAAYDFGIMITCDEELNKNSDGSGVGYLVRAGFRPSVVILPDSTAPGWDLEKVAKGWWRFDLLATGKTAHGARPWEGESASIKLIHALHELKEHFKDHGPLTDTLNIGAIHGDGPYNQVPDRMAAKVEIRLVDTQSGARNKQFIDALCAKHGLSYTTHVQIEPMYGILDHPLVDAYRDTVERIVGKRPAEYISLGGTDAHYFVAQGIPCIISCPEGGGHHSKQEWLRTDSFLQFVPIVREYLERTARNR